MSQELVARIKAELEAAGVDLSGPCGAWNITKRVAWELREQGYGLLEKHDGNNCNGYSVDFIVHRLTLEQWDILVDAGGRNEPTWNRHSEHADPNRWRPPFNDWQEQPVEPVPEPGPAPTPPDGDAFDDLVAAITANTEAMSKLALLILSASSTLSDSVAASTRELTDELKKGLRVRF